MEALERLMEEDAAADRPFIAALAISKARGGLPGPGSSIAPDVSAGSRAIRTVRTRGRFTPAELNAVFAFYSRRFIWQSESVGMIVALH
jgi:hypothetical protein